MTKPIIIALAFVALAIAAGAFSLMKARDSKFPLISQLATNKVDRTAAARIASSLKLGMREKDIEKILAANGLIGSLKLGCSHGWTSVFTLSDGCDLALDIAPRQARSDGAWADGLLRAANIQSNGVKIASITLKN